MADQDDSANAYGQSSHSNAAPARTANESTGEAHPRMATRSQTEMPPPFQEAYISQAEPQRPNFLSASQDLQNHQNIALSQSMNPSVNRVLTPASSDVYISRNQVVNPGISHMQNENMSTPPAAMQTDINISNLENILRSMGYSIPNQVASPLSTTGPTYSHISETNILPKTELRVPRKEFNDTTTSQSALLSNIKFSLESPVNKKSLKALNMILRDCKLFRLATKTRPSPIYAANNVYGYTQDTVTRSDNGDIILTDKDDLFNYDHDIKRLYSIMFMCTALDMRHIVTSAMDKQDGIEWYTLLVAYINGTTNSDIRKARRHLEDLKLPSSKTIKENIASLLEAIDLLEISSDKMLSDDDKLYYLEEKLEKDSRVVVVSYMGIAKLAKYTFTTILKGLTELDPLASASARLSAMTSEPLKELCRRHLEGRCRNGDSCIYSHLPASASRATKTASSYPGNTTRSLAKIPVPTESHGKNFYPAKSVTSDHRAQVHGPKTQNRFQYSQKTMNLVEQANPKTWSNGNASYFKTKQRPTEHTMNMLNVEEYIQYCNHAPGVVRQQPHHNGTMLTQTELQSVIMLIQDYLPVQTTFRKYRSPVHDLKIYMHHHTERMLHCHPPINDVTERQIIIGFRWLYPILSTRDFSNLPQDILLAEPKLMKLIYTVNKAYLRADCIIPLDADNSPHYMTFAPWSNKYRYTGFEGFYQSTMTSVTNYYMAINTIQFQNDITPDTEAYFHVCIIYDFMSFISLEIRRRTDTGLLPAAVRMALCEEVDVYKCSRSYMEYNHFHDIFIAIIKNVRLAPHLTQNNPDDYSDNDEISEDIITYPTKQVTMPSQELVLPTPPSDGPSASSSSSSAVFVTDLTSPLRRSPCKGDLPPAKRVIIDPVSRLRTERVSTPFQPPRPPSSSDTMSLLTCQPNKTILSIVGARQHKTVIDSGASTSGTGSRSLLTNLRPATCTVTAAFGDSAQPSEQGDLPPFMLETMYIDKMNDTTLLSVSQACGTGMCGIFTAVDCRFYIIDDIIHLLDAISLEGREQMRGVVKDGLYIQESM